MVTKQHGTTSAIEIMDNLVPPTSEDLAMRAKFMQDFEVAELIYEARTQAKLTQAQLAKKVGTTQSVISKLEDADYDGHSMSMLRRIAEALDRRVVISFAPRQDAA